MTSVKPEDLLLSTTVTLKNVGSSMLYDVQYMRNVDPDQEAPWADSYETRNYVLYQPYRASDGVDRSNPASPDMCLVIADGVNYPGQLTLGLGTAALTVTVRLGCVMHDCIVDVGDFRLDVSKLPCVPLRISERRR